MKMTLPTDSEERKNIPLLRGLFRYAPAALAGVARISKIGNDKHNPGEELHHARGKSTDHGDCILRHLMDVQDILAVQERDPASFSMERLLDEVDQLAWRALMLSQELHEKFGGVPMAPGAKEKSEILEGVHGRYAAQEAIKKVLDQGLMAAGQQRQAEGPFEYIRCPVNNHTRTCDLHRGHIGPHRDGGFYF